MTPLSTLNTRLSPPPLTVTPAAGPVIVSVPPLLLSSSWPAVSVMVWLLAKTIGSKVIVRVSLHETSEIDGPAQVELAGGQARAVGGGVDHQRPSLSLESADVGCGGEWEAALVGGDAAGGRARADGGTAGQQGHGMRSVRYSRLAGPGPDRRGWRGRCCRWYPPTIPPDPPVPIKLNVPVTSPAWAPPISLGPPWEPVLPATMVSVSVAVLNVNVGELVLYRPPEKAGSPVAELPVTVQAVRVSIAVPPPFHRPPPAPPELLLIVQLVNAIAPVPKFTPAPPLPVAELPVIVLSARLIVAVPELML